MSDPVVQGQTVPGAEITPLWRLIVARLAFIVGYASLCIEGAERLARQEIATGRSLLLFAGAVFAVTKIIVDSDIAAPFVQAAGKIPLIGKYLYDDQGDEIHGLFGCSLCTGVWVGAVVAILGVHILGGATPSALELAIQGIIGGGIAWLLSVVSNRINS